MSHGRRYIHTSMTSSVIFMVAACAVVAGRWSLFCLGCPQSVQCIRLANRARQGSTFDALSRSIVSIAPHYNISKMAVCYDCAILTYRDGLTFVFSIHARRMALREASTLNWRSLFKHKYNSRVVHTKSSHPKVALKSKPAQCFHHISGRRG